MQITPTPELLLSAINTLVLLIGVPFAIHTLRTGNKQRRADSVAQLLTEYRDGDLQSKARVVAERFTVFTGPTEERLEEFIAFGRHSLKPAHLEAARVVVNKLNDLGVLMERGIVKEEHFFRHVHPQIVELAARLDPLILLVSAGRGSRWGFRVRRMGTAAALFYRMNPIYNDTEFRQDGKVLIEIGRPPLRAQLGVLFSGYLRKAKVTRRHDKADQAIAAQVLARHPARDIAFLRPLVPPDAVVSR